MEKFNVVVILCNGVQYGVWSYTEELSVSKRNDIKHAIKEKVKAMGTKDVFTVIFSDTYPSDDTDEMLDGILESIDNDY